MVVIHSLGSFSCSITHGWWNLVLVLNLYRYEVTNIYIISSFPWSKIYFALMLYVADAVGRFLQCVARFAKWIIGEWRKLDAIYAETPKTFVGFGLQNLGRERHHVGCFWLSRECGRPNWTELLYLVLAVVTAGPKHESNFSVWVNSVFMFTFFKSIKRNSLCWSTFVNLLLTLIK